MKKNLLALSVAAALGAGVSAAQAQYQLVAGAENTGNALVVPYYSVQNGMNTLFSIVNTDSTRGKAVKVRFRGAERSDDVFDFQVFLSPNDVWTAMVTQADNGLARLETNDNSCTLPANVNQNFVTLRLTDPVMHATAADAIAGTREGYIEIISMGDIVSNGTAAQNALFTATKHVNGVAPCTFATLASIQNGNNASGTTITGMDNVRLHQYSTGGLFSNVTLINVGEASSWSMNALPVQPSYPLLTRYWPQTALPFKPGLTPDDIDLRRVTLDYLFIGATVPPAQYDLPDLSTPRWQGDWPKEQYDWTNWSIGLFGSLSNEFLTDDAIFAATDWTMTFPTRRYGVEGRDPTINWNWTSQTLRTGVIAPFFNVVEDGYEGTKFEEAQCIRVTYFDYWDREEREPSTPDEEVVISPGVPEEPFTLLLCGEVAVVSFNNEGATTSGALGAELTLNDATLPYIDGWATINFAGALPVIAYSHVKANNGGAGATQYNFGGSWKHRTNYYGPF